MRRERRARRLSRGPSADGVVIAEPTNGGFDVVAVGVIWARLTFEASARHASHADEGSNPIETAFAAVEALRGLEAELNADPSRSSRVSSVPTS